MSTIDKTSASQLALSTGLVLGDVLGGALKAYQSFSDVGLHTKLVNAQIDQAVERGTPPTHGAALATQYAGQGAYYGLPPLTAESTGGGMSSAEKMLLAVVVIGALAYVVVR